MDLNVMVKALRAEGSRLRELADRGPGLDAEQLQEKLLADALEQLLNGLAHGRAVDPVEWVRETVRFLSGEFV